MTGTLGASNHTPRSLPPFYGKGAGACFAPDTTFILEHRYW